jgi:ABC-2 type transport system permease protein
MTPITPQNYLTVVQTLMALFVTAQAPELLGRDQRHHVLTLYFSRALERTDYALAKYAALVCALALVLLVPQVVLVLGIVFASIDLGAGLGEALPVVAPILFSTLIAAAFFSGIGLLIAAFTPRRAFASGAIVAAFLVLSGVVSVIVFRGGLRDGLRYVALLDPYALLDGLASTLFGSASRNLTVARSGLEPGDFAVGACVVAVATLIALVLRYRRIEA